MQGPRRFAKQKPRKTHPAHTESWDQVSQWYSRLVGEKGSYQKELILPRLLGLIQPKQGMTIADLGCGPGFFSQAFAQKGARVIGVDISEKLIKQARKSCAGVSAEFHVGPADRTPLPSASCGEAVIVLALQNMERAEDVVGEAARILEPEGTLHVVLNHPAFRVPRSSAWGEDPARKMQFRRVDRYMSIFAAAIQMHPGADPGRLTSSFHRPLEWYAGAFLKAGFVLTGLEEWVSERASQGRKAVQENRARNEFPLFLYLRGRLSKKKVADKSPGPK